MIAAQAANGFSSEVLGLSGVLVRNAIKAVVNEAKSNLRQEISHMDTEPAIFTNMAAGEKIIAAPAASKIPHIWFVLGTTSPNKSPEQFSLSFYMK